jgi:hypothetical protein
MNTLMKTLIGLAVVTTTLAGCVVVPARPRAYVAVPAPVVVVRPYGYYHYYGPR